MIFSASASPARATRPTFRPTPRPQSSSALVGYPKRRAPRTGSSSACGADRPAQSERRPPHLRRRVAEEIPSPWWGRRGGGHAGPRSTAAPAQARSALPRRVGSCGPRPRLAAGRARDRDVGGRVVRREGRGGVGHARAQALASIPDPRDESEARSQPPNPSGIPSVRPPALAHPS